MKSLLQVTGFFAFILLGIGVAEFIGNHYATEAGIILFAAIFYGLYRAARFIVRQR